MLASCPLTHSVDLLLSLASRSLFPVAHQALWDVAHGSLALLLPAQQSHWLLLRSWNTLFFPASGHSVPPFPWLVASDPLCFSLTLQGDLPATPPCSAACFLHGICQNLHVHHIFPGPLGLCLSCLGGCQLRDIGDCSLLY